MEKLYGCQEIADRYGVSIRTVWDWIKKGKLAAINTGKLYSVRESDLLKFESERMTIQSDGESTAD